MSAVRDVDIAAMSDLKPWLSLDNQLSRIKARGLQIEDEVAARSYLARIGYYRLSGYWYPLRRIDREASMCVGQPVRRDEFIPGSRFEDVAKLYVFDKKLRLLALDALERIEMAVRVDVAYRLGKKNPCAHEDPHCLDGKFARRAIKKGSNAGKTEHQVWLEKYQKLLHRARRESFVVHHQQAYGGRLPIWVAIEVWDFGLLSKLFAGMRHSDQDAIALRYGAPTGRTFSQWLRSLNFIRNVAAHHSRLWNINVLESSPVPPRWPVMVSTKPFMYFALMQYLLREICPNSSWGRRFRELLEREFPMLPEHSAQLADMGTFEGWEEWSLWGHK